MKRIGVYFFYDADGIVDDYVGYFLENINLHLDKLVVVVNGKLTAESKKYLETYSRDVFVRENIGFDVWAYKAAIEYIGWDNLSQYDELLLMNYTQFGPIYPFSEMFDAMDTRTELDFWGITKYHRYDGATYNTIYDYIPEHLQSSFIVLRKKLFTSVEYKTFWENMREIKSYNDSVGYYESIFTKTFNDFGFRSDSYVDTSDLASISEYPLILMPDELIINRRCPVFKRRSLFHDGYVYILSNVMPNKTRKTLDFISNSTEYDMKLIWKNILRMNNMRDIAQMLELNYVLPTAQFTGSVDNNLNQPNIGLVAHIYFEDQIDFCLSYIHHTKCLSIDILITTHSIAMQEKIQNELKHYEIEAKVIIIQNRGRDISALLVGAKDFVLAHDLICFVHDKKAIHVKPYSVGQGFAEYCFENTLSSNDYIKNVVNLFNVNPYLGVLSPPHPLVGFYINCMSDPWGENFECTKKFLQAHNFKVPISREKSPVAPYGTMFWFRTEALKSLFELNLTYEDFPEEPNKYDGTILHAIERAYPLVAQHAGFYSANVVTEDTARTQLTTFQYKYAELQRGYAHVADDLTYHVYRKIIAALPKFIKKPLKYMLIKLLYLKNKISNIF